LSISGYSVFQYVSISAGRSFVNQVISLSAMLVARLRQHNPIDKIGFFLIFYILVVA
jgi:nucleoside recognition membrane protein YjiH